MTEIAIVSPITIDNFRGMFRVFADPQKYSDVEIQPWLALSDRLLNANLWQDIKPMGQALFTAHNLVLTERDKRADAAGGIPGASGSGIVSSKSVGGASISYDTQAGLEQGAGYYNLSTYGTRFYRMMRLIGMGGSQLGGGPFIQPAFSGPAWPGVIAPIWRP